MEINPLNKKSNFNLIVGCCGAAYKSGCMLGSFIVILFVLFGGAVGAVVFLHTQFGWQAVMEVLNQVLKTIRPGFVF